MNSNKFRGIFHFKLYSIWLLFRDGISLLNSVFMSWVVFVISSNYISTVFNLAYSSPLNSGIIFFLFESLSCVSSKSFFSGDITMAVQTFHYLWWDLGIWNKVIGSVCCRNLVFCVEGVAEALCPVMPVCQMIYHWRWGLSLWQFSVDVQVGHQK